VLRHEAAGGADHLVVAEADEAAVHQDVALERDGRRRGAHRAALVDAGLIVLEIEVVTEIEQLVSHVSLRVVVVVVDVVVVLEEGREGLDGAAASEAADE